jgi:hypothetical protein
LFQAAFDRFERLDGDAFFPGLTEGGPLVIVGGGGRVFKAICLSDNRVVRGSPIRRTRLLMILTAAERRRFVAVVKRHSATAQASIPARLVRAAFRKAFDAARVHDAEERSNG